LTKDDVLNNEIYLLTLGKLLFLGIIYRKKKDKAGSLITALDKKKFFVIIGNENHFHYYIDRFKVK
jgi:hypothetical protein